MAYEKTERSTMHGMITPHGMKTPHRYPTDSSNSLLGVLSILVRELYPTGRAWFMKRNGVFFNLHQALNRSIIRFTQDADLTLDSCFPDNINFDADDASLWEYRLGLVTNESLSLEVRKQAILRKMAYPGNVRARQSPLFIQDQLQKAGFDVYVHENTPPYKTPDEIVSLSITATQHGGGTQHGIGTQHGSTGYEVIANLSTPNEVFSVGSNLYATFFIGGLNLGDTANVYSSRLQEFRELVLKLKPAQTVVFTFINYI